MEKAWSKSELARRYDLFVFDLDGTLYDERSYLFSAYRAIAARLGEAYPAFPPEAYEAFLCTTFRQEGRKQLFDKCIAHFRLPVQVAELTDILHRHEAALQLDTRAEGLLDFLAEKDKRLYILTNGNVQQQQNKVRLLGLEGRYPGIGVVYASATAPKPSPLCLQHILQETGISSGRTVLVGDTEVDEETARRAAVDYIFIQNIL
ncbi:MAG: HAD family hydrolase [Bacteroidales bacterium]|nr:HAD family hydrolase [Bacteroidales bacterium]